MSLIDKINGHRPHSTALYTFKELMGYSMLETVQNGFDEK